MPCVSNNTYVCFCLVLCLVQLRGSNTFVPVPVAIQRPGETLGGRAAHVHSTVWSEVAYCSLGGGGGKKRGEFFNFGGNKNLIIL